MIPFLSLLRRETMRFLKVIVQTVFTPLVSSCLYLLVFGVSLGAAIQLPSKVPYLAFLIPGLVMMGLMNNAFQNSSSSIVIAKFTGELEDLRVVPLSPSAILWAMGLAAVVRGIVVGGVTFLVGFIFYYYRSGEFLSVAHPFELILVAVMGGLVFGFLGLASAFWAKSFDQLSAVNAFILLPLTYLGGVFISVEQLHPFWQKLSHANPLFYFINGMRHAIVGVSDVPIDVSLWVIFGSAVLFYGVAHWSLKTAVFQRWG